MDKQCGHCKKFFSFDLYCKRKGSKDGLSAKCLYCRRVDAKKYENKEVKKQNWKRWYENNREKILIKARNRKFLKTEQMREIDRARDRERYKTNPIPWKKRSRLREKRLLLATPSWADKSLINSTYALAVLLDHINPWIKHHVDHTIPLKGKNVCGLHVENNLSIISAEQNLKKGISVPNFQ